MEIDSGISNGLFVAILTLVVVVLCAGMVFLAWDGGNLFTSVFTEPAQVYTDVQTGLRQSGPVGEVGADVIAWTIVAVAGGLVFSACAGWVNLMKKGAKR